MIKKFLNEFKQLNTKVIRIVNIGLCVSLAIGIFGILLIIIYDTYSGLYDLYKAGYILIKTALIFSAQFVSCGLVFDKILKENI